MYGNFKKIENCHIENMIETSGTLTLWWSNVLIRLCWVTRFCVHVETKNMHM